MSLFWIIFIALAAVVLVPLTILFVVGGLALVANMLARGLVWLSREPKDAVQVAPEKTPTVDTSE